MLFVVTVAIKTFIKHVLLCQLRFFGFLQQILILANLNKLGFIKKILEAPTIVGSFRPSPGNMQEGWQLWRKEIGPSRKPAQPEPPDKDHSPWTERTASHFYLPCPSSWDLNHKNGASCLAQSHWGSLFLLSGPLVVYYVS